MSERARLYLKDFLTLFLTMVIASTLIELFINTPHQMQVFGGIFYVYGSTIQRTFDEKHEELKRDQASNNN